jgi:hypothetical protein
MEFATLWLPPLLWIAAPSKSTVPVPKAVVAANRDLPALRVVVPV